MDTTTALTPAEPLAPVSGVEDPLEMAPVATAPPAHREKPRETPVVLARRDVRIQRIDDPLETSVATTTLIPARPRDSERVAVSRAPSFTPPVPDLSDPEPKPRAEAQVTPRPDVETPHRVNDATDRPAPTKVVAPRSPVTILSPKNLHSVLPEDPPIVVVEGEVDDGSTPSVTLVANGERHIVPVVAGRFRHVLPTIEPTTRLWAEMFQDGAPWRSAVVTVGRKAAKVPGALVVLEGSDEVAMAAEISVTWRQRPDRLDGASRPLPAAVVRDGSPVGAFAAFYVSGLKDGAYTFVVKNAASIANPVRARLYLQAADGVRVRTLAAESGAVAPARMLLPQGAFWDDDEWFTGRSETVDTITKFRFPEGVSWIERKRLP